MGDDNLMDEMENGAPDKAPEKVIPSKKVPSKTAKKQPSKASKKQGFQIPEKVDIMWVVALIVAAFVIGFFVRGAIEQPVTDTALSPMMQDSPGDVSSSQSQGGSGNMGAPALNESQLNGGQMPSSHPKIDDEGNLVGTPGAGSGAKSDVPASGSPEGKSVDVKKDPGSK